MAAPKMPAADDSVPPELQNLVEQLAKLDSATQQRVLRAANRRERRPMNTIPFDELREAFGIVNFGGNAVEDCNSIYDDV